MTLNPRAAASRVLPFLLAAASFLPAHAASIGLRWDPVNLAGGYRVCWNTTQPSGWPELPSTGCSNVPLCSSPAVQPCYPGANGTVIVTFPDPALGTELFFAAKAWRAATGGGFDYSAAWSNPVSKSWLDTPDIDRTDASQTVATNVQETVGDLLAFCVSGCPATALGIVIEGHDPVGVDEPPRLEWPTIP